MVDSVSDGGNTAYVLLRPTERYGTKRDVLESVYPRGFRGAQHERLPTVTTRNANGSGSIRDPRTPGGNYEVRWRDALGIRRSAHVPGAKSDAASFLAARIAERDRGVPAGDRTLTLGAWLPRWLDAMPPGRLRPRSEQRYRDVVRLQWARDPMMRMRLVDLTPEHVGLALGRMARRGTTPGGCDIALTILRIALSDAERAGLVGRNAARLTTRPRIEPRAIVPPSAVDQSAIREAIEGDRLEALWSLALGVGLRQGEILALRWGDVDLGAGLVTVRGTLAYGSSRVGAPKSSARVRYPALPMPAWVTSALAEHYRAVAHASTEGRARIPTPTAFVFATSTGKPLHARNVLGWWYAVCERAGVRRYRMHDLRHAAITNLVMRGVAPAIVQAYAGHSSPTQTSAYTHAAFSGLDLGEDAPRFTPALTPAPPVLPPQNGTERD